ncbi:hypothetical protein PR048_026117 [Dryococelus australis]|uniref:Uncharacterized protein n=1 Tax=Dryococelus australis TaxID=614101 RepID=A0ABQ9GKF1_9NEOP|nr:hypothetical protein PR048_026117 [Dryococelus australis]
MRVIEVSMEQRRNEGVGKRGIPEKTGRAAASSGTIPACKNPGVIQPGTEPGSPWSDEALGVRVTVARIAPSLLDLGRASYVVPLKLTREQTSLGDVERHRSSAHRPLQTATLSTLQSRASFKAIARRHNYHADAL